MKTILTLAMKDIRLLWRDKGGLFWVIGFPFLMALFFGAIFSGDSDPKSAGKIGVIDEDGSAYSQAFINELGNSDAITTVALPLDSATQEVRRGNMTAYVRVKKGFGDPGKFFSQDSSMIELGIDPARRVTSGLYQGLVTQAWFKAMQQQFMNSGRIRESLHAQLDSVQSDQTIAPDKKQKLTGFFSSLDNFLGSYDTSIMQENSPMQGPKIATVSVIGDADRPRTSYEVTFPSAILWALIGCASTFAVSIVTERTRGTMLRLRMAPISRMHILAGKGLACFMTAIGVSALLLLFGKMVFGVRLNNPLMLALAVGTAAFCFSGLMMLISVIGKTEQAVGGAGMAILLIMAMTGGGMIPLMFMPKWLTTVSNFSPVKWGILAAEGAIWRNFSVSEMMLPLGVLLTIGVVAFAIGVFILSQSEV